MDVAALREASLPDGTVVKVDAKTAYALGLMQQLSESLALGQMDVVFIAWDGPGLHGPGTHSMVYYNDPGKLGTVSALLQAESKRLPKIASLWEGTAPAAARSFREQ